MQLIVKDKLAKRQLDPRSLQFESPVVSLNQTQQKAVLQQGISQQHAKQIVQLLKQAKLKVQASIQGQQVRVQGKKRDELQAAMQCIQESDLPIAVQFTNFRD